MTHKTKKWFILTGVICIGGAVAFFFFLDSVKNYLPAGIYKEEPKAFFLDYGGHSVNIYDLRGKPTIMYSWSSTFQDSRKQLTDMANLKGKYGDKVYIVAVNRGESKDMAKAFTDAAGVTDRMILLLDPTNSFYTAIGGSDAHESVFINHFGVIVGRVKAMLGFNEMEQGLKNMDPAVL